MHYSAGEGQVDVVDVLIHTKDINVNAKDNEGKTALHYAALLEQKETVQKLLSAKGIDPTIKDNDGETAATITSSNEIKALFPKKGKK